MARTAVLVALAALVPALAGCFAPDEPPDAGTSLRTFQVTSAGTPIVFPAVTLLAQGVPVVATSGDAAGRVELEPPVSATHAVVGAPGHEPRTLALADLPVEVTLAPLASGAPAVAAPLLGFRTPVALRCPDGPVGQVQDAAFRRICGGYGEPVMEYSGDGTVWASATCCIGRAPPIWVSRDRGATFQLLDRPGTGIVREGFGVEGDFAVDDAGNVYFFDMFAQGGAWFTSYAADGSHRWTLPLSFHPASVDRPWVRAGAADQVFIAYNTVGSTKVHTSRDGGRTWDESLSAPCSLGTLGSGPAPSRVFLTACAGGKPRFWISEDGGKNWGPPESLPVPGNESVTGIGMDFQMNPVADEAGNVYVVYTNALDEESHEVGVFVVRRSLNGTWSGPFAVATTGQNAQAWIAAGRAGGIAVAWYHADENGSVSERPASVWRLMAAISLDADAERPHFQVARADPLPVDEGAGGPALGDFLQADISPLGEVGVVYARSSDAGPYAMKNWFVQSDGALTIAPQRYPNGP